MLTSGCGVAHYGGLTQSLRGSTMKEVGLSEVKTRLSELPGEVESGQKFVITRCGVAVARSVAAAPAGARRAQGNVQGNAQSNAQSNAQRKHVNQAFAELSQLRIGAVLDIPLKDAINNGRD